MSVELATHEDIAKIEKALGSIATDLHRVASTVEALRKSDLPDMLTVAEAARHLKVTPATVRRRFRRGLLPGRRIGRQIRIPRHALSGE